LDIEYFCVPVESL